MPKVKKNFIDRGIEYVSPTWGARRAYTRAKLELASTFYRGSSTDRLRSEWIYPGMKDTTPYASELARLRGRSRDLNRNDPVASGATDTMATNIIGQGLKPQSQIRAEVLGIEQEQAQELRKQAEAAFSLFSPYADSGNRLTFNEIQFLALRKICEDGEIIALPVWAKDPWRKINRAIELIESDRLGGSVGASKTTGYNDTGIEVGPRGEPLRYWLQKADYGNLRYDKFEYQMVPARDRDGRPMILHVYPSRRAGQMRGIPLFAPVLNYFKDLADYLEAEVVAARVAACLAIFITKQSPLEAAWMNQTETEPGSNARIQAVEPGMVNYLGIGENINVVDPKRPGDSFAPFVEGVLRIIGTSLGLPYELLVKDFSKTNYSSARAALLEGRRMFLSWRGWFSEKFCQPIWELVLEEAFLRGLFQAPDFYENKAEYCRCQWVGGAWGWVDPVKEVEAAKLAIDYNLSTLAEEAAGQGRDWEEILEQRSREDARIRELGLENKKAGPATLTPNPEDNQDGDNKEEKNEIQAGL